MLVEDRIHDAVMIQVDVEFVVVIVDRLGFAPQLGVLAGMAALLLALGAWSLRRSLSRPM